MLGSAGSRLASPPNAAILNSDLETSHLKNTAQRHVINTSFDSMALSTNTDGTTETDNTW